MVDDVTQMPLGWGEIISKHSGTIAQQGCGSRGGGRAPGVAVVLVSPQL